MYRCRPHLPGQRLRRRARHPHGLEDASKLPAITAGLRARGLSPSDVEKILGGNVLRVLEANEQRR